MFLNRILCHNFATSTLHSLFLNTSRSLIIQAQVCIHVMMPHGRQPTTWVSNTFITPHPDAKSIRVTDDPCNDSLKHIHLSTPKRELFPQARTRNTLLQTTHVLERENRHVYSAEHSSAEQDLCAVRVCCLLALCKSRKGHWETQTNTNIIQPTFVKL